MASILGGLLTLASISPVFGQGNDPSRREGGLRIGDPAPDFRLGVLEDHGQRNAEDRVRLSGFFGERPVVLIFGSYT